MAIAAAIVLWSLPASAETAEERQACIGDAFRVCWAAIPDRQNVLACLVENRSRLNPDCREVINRYSRHQHRHRGIRSAHSARARPE
ncbi:MAG TPA: hypothetical protein VFB29_06150 [Pseudolabrys sp.]|nr:hypothetical protein [Pseudolabrys sp.]